MVRCEFAVPTTHTAFAGKEKLKCDDDIGAQVCRIMQAECLANANHTNSSLLNMTSSASLYLHENCPCYENFGECLTRIECNGTSMYNAMLICNGRPNCTKCSFYAAAPSVIPAFSLLVLAAAAALFF